MAKVTWLPENWSCHFVGGHDTEVSVVGWCIEHAVKIKFPPNDIPCQVMDSLNGLKAYLREADVRIQAFLELVQEHLEEE